MLRFPLSCLALAALAACTMGPDYKRPDVVSPTGWRAPAPVPAPDVANLANTAWWKTFDDAELDALIEIALQENKDLQRAAYRVQQFDAKLEISQAASKPHAGFNGNASHDQLSRDRQVALSPLTPRVASNYEYSVNASWEIDVWGRVRRANEAALAQLVSTEDNQRALILMLVSDVASSYIQLLALDRDLEITKLTLQSRADSVKFFQDKFNDGGIAELPLAQARAAYEETASYIPDLERQIQTIENALSLLVGRNPGPIKRGRSFETLVLPGVPAGIPSEVLTRRPDVAKAEQDLVAANALIGVAKTEYFPTLSLTAVLGFASQDLRNWTTGPSNYYSGGGSLTGPLFSGGRIEGDIRAAEAAQKEAETTYLQSIQTALREVEDALVAKQKAGEQLDVRGRQIAALQHYVVLAQKRYEGGYSSYIDVLEAQRSLLDAQMQQVQTRRDVYVALTSIYKSMGGGWVMNPDITHQTTTPGTTAAAMLAQAASQPETSR